MHESCNFLPTAEKVQQVCDTGNHLDIIEMCALMIHWGAQYSHDDAKKVASIISNCVARYRADHA